MARKNSQFKMNKVVIKKIDVSIAGPQSSVIDVSFQQQEPEEKELYYTSHRVYLIDDLVCFVTEIEDSSEKI